MVHNLESFPWPWEDSSVDEIRAHHVLEHLGQDPMVFVKIMKEMYRVCKPGATLDIVVPHPRHDNFINDPTHVRPITMNVMSLFSKGWNKKWEADGSANTKLAMEFDIDFLPVSQAFSLEPRVQRLYEAGAITDLEQLIAERSNIVQSIHMTLQAVK